MTRPWSTNQLRRLGEAIRDGREPPAGVPAYSEVMAVFNDAAAEVQSRIAAIDFASVLDRPVDLELTSRAKTIDTLREKLIRDHGMALPSIQDVAGVRLDAQMVLSEQDKIAEAIATAFGGQPAAIVKDLRDGGHSGYRAVHIWLRLDQRVEVQIRTTLQSEWANLYEAFGDLYGREIRYGQLPQDPGQAKIVQDLQTLSLESIASAESAFERIRDPVRLAEFRAFVASGDYGQELTDVLALELSPRETVEELEGVLQAALRDLRYFVTSARNGEE